MNDHDAVKQLAAETAQRVAFMQRKHNTQPPAWDIGLLPVSSKSVVLARTSKSTGHISLRVSPRIVAANESLREDFAIWASAVVWGDAVVAARTEHRIKALL